MMQINQLQTMYINYDIDLFKELLTIEKIFNYSIKQDYSNQMLDTQASRAAKVIDRYPKDKYYVVSVGERNWLMNAFFDLFIEEQENNDIDIFYYYKLHQIKHYSKEERDRVLTQLFLERLDNRILVFLYNSDDLSLEHDIFLELCFDFFKEKNVEVIFDIQTSQAGKQTIYNMFSCFTFSYTDVFIPLVHKTLLYEYDYLHYNAFNDYVSMLRNNVLLEVHKTPYYVFLLRYLTKEGLSFMQARY